MGSSNKEKLKKKLSALKNLETNFQKKDLKNKKNKRNNKNLSQNQDEDFQNEEDEDERIVDIDYGESLTGKKVIHITKEVGIQEAKEIEKRLAEFEKKRDSMSFFERAKNAGKKFASFFGINIDDNSSKNTKEQNNNDLVTNTEIADSNKKNNKKLNNKKSLNSFKNIKTDKSNIHDNTNIISSKTPNKSITNSL